jgi:NAD(P) transhydrogenase subunit alpha
MPPGSVVVDLAGEAGGNCELTEPGETVVRHEVKIVSPLNLPASMPEHASQLFARNVQALLELLVDENGQLSLDFDDEIVGGACIVRDGEIVNSGAKAAVEAQSAAPSAVAENPRSGAQAKPMGGTPGGSPRS